MKKLIAFTLLMTSLTAPAHAEDCIERACIDVYTQDGKIVIEGRKGSGPVEKKAVAPAPAQSRKPIVRKPKVQKPVVPKSKVAGSDKPKVLTSTKKPVVRKKPTPAPTTSATSLSDKLIEMLPTAGIAYSPAFQPLIKVPVYFWCDIPEVVTKKIEIVGEIVEVSLKPTFIWHYGDGTFFITRKAGSTFPDGEIRHAYSKQGHYLVELITSWDGEFTVQGVKARIPGEIKSISIVPITVVAAPSRFTPPVLYKKGRP